MRFRVWTSLIVLVSALAGCAATAPAPRLVAVEESRSATIYLVGHGFHTGLVVAQQDVPRELWPERRDFPDARWLEVGWGDRDYYRADDPGLWISLRAVFVPTPSVLHVVGVRGRVEEYFAANELVAIRLSPAAVGRLAQYIHDAFERTGVEPAAAIGPGLYGDSRFYAAREAFHLFRTCNVWTAGALRAAGLPVSDAVTGEGLMSQVRTLGTVVHSAPG